MYLFIYLLIYLFLDLFIIIAIFLLEYNFKSKLRTSRVAGHSLKRFYGHLVVRAGTRSDWTMLTMQSCRQDPR